MSLAVSLFLLLVSSAIIAYIHVFTRVCPCRWDGYKGDDGEDFALFTTVFSTPPTVSAHDRCFDNKVETCLCKL